MIAYLSGPIENAENDGADWRLSITHWLKDEINHNVFNPVEATRGTISGITNDEFREMKKTEPEIYKTLIRKIIDIDIKAVVENSDYLIVNWDESVFKGGGTHGEITLAYYLKKPIYLINHVSLDDLSSWIFSCSTEVFDSFDDLKIYLSKIPDETLYAYNVYQIEGEGRNLFSSILGDEDTVMGLPVLKIKELSLIHI